MIKERFKYLPISLFIVLIDQLSKWYAVNHLRYAEPLEVIKGFFNLYLIFNPGMIWGMFSNHPNPIVPKVITIISFVVLLLVIGMFLFSRTLHLLEKIAFALIIGGALSNIIDRIVHGYVIDFFDFYIKGYHWPTFNLADSSISIGIFLYILTIFIRREDAPNFDQNR